MADVVVLGSVNSDLVAGLDTLPSPGATVLARSLRESGGGKGANQAVAAARLGASVAFVGAVGADDRGRAMRAALMAEGVDTAGLRVAADTPTGAALILVDSSAENVIVVAPGANMMLDEQDVECAAALLTPCSVLLCQLEIPQAVVTAAARAARSTGARVVLNAAPADGVDNELLADADVLVVNAAEAAALLGRVPIMPADGPDAARELSRVVPAVVLTLGAHGAVVADNDGVATVRPHPVQAIDTVGAGDAFTGALACELARGMSLRAAAATGAAAGALAACAPGAQDSMPTRAQLDALTTITAAAPGDQDAP